MRIAIVNWSSRKVGGIETYLSTLIPKLVESGNDVAFCCEVDEPGTRDRITLPPAVQSWCVSALGIGRALAALGDWQPDVLYTHKLSSPQLEARLLNISPAVFFAHDYQGTCISGNKTHQFPSVKVCERRFGPLCMLHYFPHRCGGLSPLTMIKLYRLQAGRLALLQRYAAVVTHSAHMLSELTKHGVSRRRAYCLPFLVAPPGSQLSECFPKSFPDSHSSDQNEAARAKSKSYVQLIFSGRMEQLKGGHVLLAALPEVQRALGKNVRLLLAGAGRKREEWERQAERLQQLHSTLEIEFVGWVNQARFDRLLDQSDLLVVPSIWPEPFGLVGPEAGLRGVPAAAFGVGGISEWLVDGVNGYLAPGDPPTAAGLAEAIVRCLGDRETHEQLRRGAVRVATEFSLDNHLAKLLEVFESVRATTPRRGAAKYS